MLTEGADALDDLFDEVIDLMYAGPAAPTSSSPTSSTHDEALLSMLENTEDAENVTSFEKKLIETLKKNRAQLKLDLDEDSTLPKAKVKTFMQRARAKLSKGKYKSIAVERCA